MKTRKQKKEVALLLHNIRSVHNVGAIFRTADAVGVTKIYLSGYTPTPSDRLGRKRGDLAKAALGAEGFVAWEYKKNPVSIISKLTGERYFVVAVEQGKGAIDYKKVKPSSSKILFIFGNEVVGIAPALQKMADVVATIPMKGEKESLNVSVAAGIALYRILEL